MTSPSLANVILAAGEGTRMKSGVAKVLHQIAGRSLLGHVMATATALETAAAVVVVTGPDSAPVVAEARACDPDVKLACQSEQLGTGHAVLAAKPALADHEGAVLVVYGDTPLLRPAALEAMVGALETEAQVVVLGFEAPDPTGYGRLICDPSGALSRIVEEKDASDEERAIRFCNSGVMAFAPGVIWGLLEQIGNDNAKGEYYLTDAIEIARRAGQVCRTVTVGSDEVLGVNSRAELAAAEAIMQDRLRRAAMKAGATLIDPATVFFSYDTVLGRDVVVEPHVVFAPGVVVSDKVQIKSFSHLEQAAIATGAVIGPYARLRPGSVIGENAKIGNFVEIKQADIGRDAKVNHLSYVGDARVGAATNIGAGTITCNYDGVKKHITEIGEGVFVGSNSSLVAPVKIGDKAYIGSGSVITEDVSADALALARSPQTEKPDWASRFQALKVTRKKPS